MAYKVVFNKGQITYKPISSFKIKKKKDDFLEHDTLTEREVLLIKRRLNDGKMKYDDVFAKKESFTLTPEQNKKGYDWVYDRYKTPSGQIRKNNPFGAREESIINNFSHFELDSFYNAGNQYRNYYVPVYRMFDKEGNSFEYYVMGGETKIIG